MEKVDKPYYIHESSYVDDNVSIGAGTKIWHFCHVQSGAVIGERCSLGQNVNVGNNVKMGNGVRVQNNVSIYDAVEIEDDVFCGPSMVFTNVINPRAFVERKAEYKKTMPAYVIGAILVFAASQIIAFIINMASGIKVS